MWLTKVRERKLQKGKIISTVWMRIDIEKLFCLCKKHKNEYIYICIYIYEGMLSKLNVPLTVVLTRTWRWLGEHTVAEQQLHVSPCLYIWCEKFSLFLAPSVQNDILLQVISWEIICWVFLCKVCSLLEVLLSVWDQTQGEWSTSVLGSGIEGMVLVVPVWRLSGEEERSALCSVPAGGKREVDR